jgi:two-component system alkaline phosphatase synthesis response regulator PhoP
VVHSALAVPDVARNPPARILLVEDEPGLVMTLTDRLHSEGFEVQVAGDAETAFARATREPWDLMLLDVMLPGGSGFDICREVRRRGISKPIIMLTALGQVSDKVQGLGLGADDYLTKPFDMLELAARIDVQLRRSSGSTTGADHTYHFGAIVVDVRKAEVTRDGAPLDLSAREFLLLKYFLEHREATLTRDELLNEVWGYRSMPSTRTVDVHVAWLRQKIEPNPKHPQYLLTVHGLGYKFVG